MTTYIMTKVSQKIKCSGLCLKEYDTRRISKKRLLRRLFDVGWGTITCVNEVELPSLIKEIDNLIVEKQALSSHKTIMFLMRESSLKIKEDIKILKQLRIVARKALNNNGSLIGTYE